MSYHHYDPAVPHLMSGPMLDVLERQIGRPGAPDVYILVEVGFPSGTMRFAKVGTGSASGAPYDGRLITAGDLVRGINERTSTIIDQEIEITVSDVGERSTNRRLLAQEFAKYRNQLRNSTVQVWLASRDVSRTDWSLRFNGRLAGLPRQDSSMNWRLRARPNDTILKLGAIPRRKVTTTAWPNAHADAVDKWHPVAMGRFDSTSMGDDGALPTLYLDTSGYRYGVSIGFGSALVDVYEDGVITAAAYTYTSVIDGEGTVWSVIDFSTDRGAAVITCDFDGLTTVGDGTGSVITNPLDQLAHVITQWAYNDYHSGNYYAQSTTTLDPASWYETALYLANKAHEGTQYFGNAGTRDWPGILSAMAEQYGLRFFWTNAGKLAVIPFPDPYITRLYDDQQLLRADELALRLSGPDSDEQGITRRIIVSYTPNVYEGKSLRDITVEDVTVDDRVTSELDFNWSAGRL